MKKSSLTARDKYLRKKFDLQEAEFNLAFEEQNRVCKICGKPPTTTNLHVDHDHAVEKTKIYSIKLNGFWEAFTKNPYLYFQARTKSEALSKVRKSLKRLSIRGILCWKCNTALKKFNDNATLMENSAKYIRGYKKNLGEGLNGLGIK